MVMVFISVFEIFFFPLVFSSWKRWLPVLQHGLLWFLNLIIQAYTLSFPSRGLFVFPLFLHCRKAQWQPASAVLLFRSGSNFLSGNIPIAEMAPQWI